MIALVVTIAGVSDLASKEWARAHLSAQSIEVGGPLRLTLVQNRGASFGLGADHPAVVASIAGMTIVAAAVALVLAGNHIVKLGLAAAVGGGLGNLVDRLSNGSVTDWIHVAGYPATFNLADVAIRAGLLFTVIGLLRARNTGSDTRPLTDRS